MAPPTKLIVRHWNSTLANEIQEFALDGPVEFLVGRDPACTMRFHPHLEDMVSRKHARLLASKDGVTITDLDSRNGTYVNRRRVNGPTRVNPGDVVQFSPGGPEITVEFDHSSVTRSVAGLLTGPNRKRRLAIGAVAAVLVAAIAVGAAWRVRAHHPASTATLQSVVGLETGWRLYEKETGKPLFQVYAPNRTLNRMGVAVPFAAYAGEFLPVFVSLEGRIEPVLSTSDGGGVFRAIGASRLEGAGAVAAKDGLILTSRRVAAPWLSAYHWDGESAGLLLAVDDDRQIKLKTPIPAQAFPMDWIPQNALCLLEGVFDVDSSNAAPVRGLPRVEGRLDFLWVAVRQTGRRLRGRVAKVHPSKELALVKVSGMGQNEVVRLEHTIPPPAPGALVSVVGWGGTVTAVFDRPERQDSRVGEGYHLRITSTGTAAGGSPVVDNSGRVFAILAGSARRESPFAAAIPARYGLELIRMVASRE